MPTLSLYPFLKYAVIYSSLICMSACATTAPQMPPITPAEIKTEVSNFDRDAVIKTAQDLYEAERYSKSYEAFQQIIIRHPKDIEGRIGWGNAALALGLGETAYSTFTSLDPDRQSPDIAMQISTGIILSEIATGRSEDEEVRLNDGLEIVQNDPRLWNALGRFHDKTRNWFASQRSYIRALSTGRAPSSVINNLGVSHMMQGQYDEALKKFTQAIDIKPSSEIYDNNRRLIYAFKGEHETAVQGLPDNRAALLLNDAGYLAMTRGDRHLARTLLTQAVDISPVHHVTAYANLETLSQMSRQGGQLHPTPADISAPALSRAWADRGASQEDHTNPVALALRP